MDCNFSLNPETKSLSCGGVDVIVFSDDYPSGHQSGITLIMHDKRMANGGDIRFEQTPGQWQPTPVRVNRLFDEASNKVSAVMHYPDKRMHMRGFNPLIYPDLELDYKVDITPYGNGVKIDVILDNPIPKSLEGKASFEIELVPVHVVGKPYIMDGKAGIFPAQPNGPTIKQKANIDLAGVYDVGDGKANLEKLLGDRNSYSPIVADDIIAMPYAEGHSFTALPDSDMYCFTVKSEDALLKLYDGRMNHNNGWFVLVSELPVERTGNVLTWYLEPRVNAAWTYKPVVEVSQLGYHPAQSKVAIIECDKNADFSKADKASLNKITVMGKEKVCDLEVKDASRFLRYHYAKADFSSVKEEGLYQVEFCGSESAIFRVGKDIYDRGVWQPVLEYFLPVQMCHMEVREKYRIWHGHCHSDDALMAPTDFNHYDGYFQGPSTLCKYKPGEHVPGLDAGGWHDAGDYDLRIESQAGEVYNLALAYETFGANYDTSTIDQEKHLVEIHQPDGKNDVQEQIEHGLLSIIGGYESMGRLYRGIICNDLRQYVLLGDGANMTDGKISEDDRWVFTEDNPNREFTVAAQLAAAHRSMIGFNEELAEKSLRIAKELYEKTEVRDNGCRIAKMHAAIELFLSTGAEEYRSYILNNTGDICSSFGRIGWIAVRAIEKIADEAFTLALKNAANEYNIKLKIECAKTPYGVPYYPRAWGAGWGIQGFGANYYYLYKAFPEIFSIEPMTDALNFVLGCHPGTNTAAFASGVGAKSMTIAYCANRADYSYIPGGVSSGTELISPDFPELLEFPFLWQQGEYVLGGGSSNYMLLVLAVIDSLK